jgi:F-type H+-transporting ATPase subunit epsilon
VALPTKLQLQVVSADRMLVNEPVDEVIIPGADGYFGVLPGHTPLLATLHVGELSFRQGGETHYLALAFGFAEVRPEGVTVLAETAERPSDIDIARAEASKERATQRIDQPAVDIDFERARIALLKALIRLQVATRVGMRQAR